MRERSVGRGVSAALGVCEIVRQAEAHGLTVLHVGRLRQPLTGEDEGWEVIEVENDWVIERERRKAWDGPWLARRAWKEAGSGEILRRFWEIGLRMAVAAEASFR